MGFILLQNFSFPAYLTEMLQDVNLKSLDILQWLLKMNHFGIPICGQVLLKTEMEDVEVTHVNTL